MADQERDKPENKGLKAAVMRYVSTSDLAQDAKQGALRGLRFGNLNQSMASYAMPMAVIFLGTEIIALGTMGGPQDITPPHDPVVSQSGAYTAVQIKAQGEREGRIIALTKNADGAYQILQTERSTDGTDHDLYLVDQQIEAWRIAADIARQYQVMVQAMGGNVLTIPDQIPEPIRYEGLSPIFQSEGSERFHRIGDNKITEQTDTFTLADAQRAAEFWTSVSTEIAGGHYASAPQSAPQGERASGNPSSALAAWALMALGVGVGLGAVGATGGIIGGVANGAARRRRQGQDMRR